LKRQEKRTQKFHRGNHCKKQLTPLRREEQREEGEMTGLRSMEKELNLTHLRRGCCPAGAGVSAGYKKAASCSAGKTANQSQVLPLMGRREGEPLAEDQDSLFPPPAFPSPSSNLPPRPPPRNKVAKAEIWLRRQHESLEYRREGLKLVSCSLMTGVRQ